MRNPLTFISYRCHLHICLKVTDNKFPICFKHFFKKLYMRLLFFLYRYRSAGEISHNGIYL